MQHGSGSSSAIAGLLNTLAPYLGSSVIVLFLKELFDRHRQKVKDRQQVAVSDARSRSVDGETLRKNNVRMQELMEVIFDLNTQVAEERKRADNAEMKLEWAELDVQHLKREFDSAKADAMAAQMFVGQIDSAAKLMGIHLADFTPKVLRDQLNITLREIAYKELKLLGAGPEIKEGSPDGEPKSSSHE